MKLTDLLRRISERRTIELEELHYTSANDQNSYASGYEQGYLDALRHVERTIAGEDEDVL